MKRNWKNYVALSIAAIVLSSCAAPQAENKVEPIEEKTQNTAAPMKNKGVEAPKFTLKDWDGQEVALADLQGKKVYLKFWASWCHFCVEGLPDLAKLVEEDNDFEIYTIVAPDYSGEYSLEEFKSWYEKNGYSRNIKILFDEKGATMKAYSVTGYPLNAFVGSDGVLVSKLPGNVANEDIIERMKNVQ